MKIRNLAALTLATLFVAQGAWAQDEEVEPQEDPFREKAKHKDSDDDEDEEEEATSTDRSFGNSGDVVVSAERLIGIARTARTMSQDAPIPDYKSTVDRAHLLVNANGDPVGYSTPRIAFDFFASDGFSLGVALGYSLDAGQFDETLFVASPRAGYALMFGEVVGVWPRLGVTFQDQKAADTKVTLLAASGELPVVFVVADQVALTLGPTLDLSLVGKIDLAGTPPKTDFSAHEVGFSGGLSFFF